MLFDVKGTWKGKMVFEWRGEYRKAMQGNHLESITGAQRLLKMFCL